MSVNLDEVMGAFTKAMQRFDGFAEASKEKQIELGARLLDLEQHRARAEHYGGGGGYVGDDGGGHALRALLEGSDELKALADRRVRSAVLELPKGYFSVKAAITSTGITYPDQRPEVVTPPQRRLRIRDLLPVVETTAGSIQYLEETGFTNNAATVSESDLKPESTLSYELKQVAIVVIAHYFKATNQVLSDLPAMEQQIDTRGRFGLSAAEDVQLLSGSGIGNNLNGLKTASTGYTGGSGTKIDVIRHAFLQLENTDFNGTAAILNPADWEDMQLAKNSNGDYLIGAPQGANPPTLWNRPVVVTSAMGAGDFLCGAFDQAALLYDRMSPRLDVGTTDDDFIRNQVVLRFETRIGLAILRPLALISGSFGS